VAPDVGPEFKPQCCKKKKRLKWAGGMVQEVECQSGKHKALSSNLRTTKKIKVKR
jgi:hypothetical protein